MAKFVIVVLPKSPASRALAQLQTPLRKIFWEKLNELSGSPFANSERAGYFAPDGGQMFRFKIVVDETRYYFQIVFKFADSRDENTLLVSDVLLRIV